ncbi:hypothetical protein UFO1_3350 [Pelosinus sp. UFO1]|nr:hypothetical protein UFO1_3350 [Pelosinus sp. UFO1]
MIIWKIVVLIVAYTLAKLTVEHFERKKLKKILLIHSLA